MQKGLHSLGCKQIWLASNQEKMILNMHQELDRYLGGTTAVRRRPEASAA